MRVLLSGASGLVGSALQPAMTERGMTVARLVRKEDQTGADAYRWKPGDGELDPAALHGVDAVVHLSGENVADGRWTDEKKRRIRHSRVGSTDLLARTIASVDNPPAVFVVASAVGYYGDRGDEKLDERSAPGTGFLAEVCQEWEAAADPARDAGVRVVHLRFGVLLSGEGGALAKMVPPFKLGVGGPLGNGKQYMSWLALSDAIRAIQFALESDALRGPVNAVSPHPVTNREFARSLGVVLRRPSVVPVPAFAVRLATGEMADEMLLASQRVYPMRLEEAAFTFQFPQLEAALQAVLD